MAGGADTGGNATHGSGRHHGRRPVRFPATGLQFSGHRPVVGARRDRHGPADGRAGQDLALPGGGGSPSHRRRVPARLALRAFSGGGLSGRSVVGRARRTAADDPAGPGRRCRGAVAFVRPVPADVSHQHRLFQLSRSPGPAARRPDRDPGCQCPERRPFVRPGAGTSPGSGPDDQRRDRGGDGDA